LFDLLRLDHFRGFEACWEIPQVHVDARQGTWATTPGAELLGHLIADPGDTDLVAEDLGYITPEVESLRRTFGLSGMRVLQFGFDGSPDNPHLPHNHERDGVVYTGTHDNDTTLAWFEALPHPLQRAVLDYLGRPEEAMPRPLLRAAFASVARLAILPMQDVLGLGAGERMNTPGTIEGNWRWRLPADYFTQKTVNRLGNLTRIYGRSQHPGG
jgi:4-alpha-glucanotransferase